MKLCKKSSLVGFALGALVASVIIFIFFNQIKSKEYGYVNIDKVISYVVKEVSGGSSKEGVKPEMDFYKKAFEQVLKRYSEENNMIIFSSPKVIEGAEDITELLIEKAFGKKRKGEEDVSR